MENIIAKDNLKIAVTGPESTGKTTLCQQLSRHFNAVFVPEYARIYLEKRKGKYGEADLIRIAQAQVESWKRAFQCSDQPVLADTELITLKIWSEEKFGHCDEEIIRLLNAQKFDFYLLCYPDIPWISDGLRENPDRDDRVRFFDWFENELIDIEANYAVVKGLGERRFIVARNTINAIISKAS